jgi:4-amino-4-deoxy-L-arabinose transferase-like glycosyltransferase
VGAPPAAVWLLAGMQVLLAVGWALLVPVYRAPDEPQHTDLALALSRGEDYPSAFDRRISAQITATSALGNLSADGAPQPDRALRYEAQAAAPRTARPSFAGAARDEPTEFRNQMPQHPPAYYLLAAQVFAALPEATSWDLQVVIVRLVGALLVAPLPLLAWATAAALVGDPRVALTAAAVPVAIPQLAHIAGAVNNDPLLVLASAVTTAAVARVLAGDLRLRVAAVAGLAAGVALYTKGFALVLPPWIALACAVPVWRAAPGRRPWQRALASAALATAAATAVGGWWWVRNVLIYGTVQPTAFAAPDAPAGFVPEVGFWAQLAFSRLVLRFWGQFGWLEAPLPWALVWGLFALVAGAVAVALCVPRWPAKHRHAELAVLLAPLLLLLAIVLPGAWTIYARTGGPAGLQGRYLYPGLVGLATVAAVGAVLLGRRRGARWLPLGVLAAAGLLHGFAALLVLRHWYGPPDPVLQAAWRGLLAWSPLPPAGILVVVVATLLTGLAAAVALAAGAVRAHPGRGAP